MSDDATKPDAANALPPRVETVTVTPGPFVYPDETPAVVVNSTLGMNYFGSLFELICVTDTLAVGPDGNLEPKKKIAARLRFDLNLAKAIHAQLGDAIKALESPPKDQVN